MNTIATEFEFRTKKAAKEAGFHTRDEWFRKWRVPYGGEVGVKFRGDEYFRESQTEELFSKSKGRKEIGPLRLGSQSVGQKRYRSVRFPVYRESDFILEPRVNRNIPPARTVDLIEAIAKVTETAAKFAAAADNSAKRKNHKRSRGFLSRARKLRELADIGIRRAIVLEAITQIGKRGGVHRYFAEGHEFRSQVEPPHWFEQQRTVREVQADYNGRTKTIRCRLMDATHTLEQFRNDPTLEW